MVRIRYKNLPAGRHAEAEPGARGVVVYLVPGLTSAQRNAALRRLRQEGSRGCGPWLPSGQLAAALAADRLRAGTGNTAAAIRRHPVGTLLPALLAAALLSAFVLASVSVRVIPALAPGTDGGASWSAPAGIPGRGGGAQGAPHDNAGATRTHSESANRDPATGTGHGVESGIGTHAPAETGADGGAPAP